MKMLGLEQKLKALRDRDEAILSFVICPAGNLNYDRVYDMADIVTEGGGNHVILLHGTADCVDPRGIVSAERRLFMESVQDGHYREYLFETAKVLHEKYPELVLIANSNIGDIVTYGTERFIKKCAEHDLLGFDIVGYPTIADPFGYNRMANENGIGWINCFMPDVIDLKDPMVRHGISNLIRTSRGEIFIVPGAPGITKNVKGENYRDVVNFIREEQAKYDIYAPIVAIGGMATAEHAYEMVKVAGADGIHYSTAFLKHYFSESHEEVVEWIKGIKKALA